MDIATHAQPCRRRVAPRTQPGPARPITVVPVRTEDDTSHTVTQSSAPPQIAAPRRQSFSQQPTRQPQDSRQTNQFQRHPDGKCRAWRQRRQCCKYPEKRWWIRGDGQVRGKFEPHRMAQRLKPESCKDFVPSATSNRLRRNDLEIEASTSVPEESRPIYRGTKGMSTAAPHPAGGSEPAACRPVHLFLSRVRPLGLHPMAELGVTA